MRIDNNNEHIPTTLASLDIKYNYILQNVLLTSNSTSSTSTSIGKAAGWPRDPRG